MVNNQGSNTIHPSDSKFNRAFVAGREEGPSIQMIDISYRTWETPVVYEITRPSKNRIIIPDACAPTNVKIFRTYI